MQCLLNPEMLAAVLAHRGIGLARLRLAKTTPGAADLDLVLERRHCSRYPSIHAQTATPIGRPFDMAGLIGVPAVPQVSFRPWPKTTAAALPNASGRRTICSATKLKTGCLGGHPRFVHLAWAVALRRCRS